MKSVLISINPKWCELIANGKKTIEVRKTKPKIEGPFKCYIYCTKPSKKYQTVCGCMVLNNDELYRHPTQGIKRGDSIELMSRDDYGKDNFLNGKVIGEFVCDTFITDKSHGKNDLFNAAACLSEKEAIEYCNGKDVYGWHISELKSYDEPRELNEFYKPCIDEEMQYCPCCKYGHEIFSPDEVECSNDLPGASYEQICLNKVTRPPQSWCYIEAQNEA